MSPGVAPSRMILHSAHISYLPAAGGPFGVGVGEGAYEEDEGMSSRFL